MDLVLVGSSYEGGRDPVPYFDPAMRMKGSGSGFGYAIDPDPALAIMVLMLGGN